MDDYFIGIATLCSLVSVLVVDCWFIMYHTIKQINCNMQRIYQLDVQVHDKLVKMDQKMDKLIELADKLDDGKNDSNSFLEELEETEETDELDETDEIEAEEDTDNSDDELLSDNSSGNTPIIYNYY